MQLAELKAAIVGLGEKSHYDRIKIFGWWLHVHKNQPTFTAADVGKCYEALHFPPPASFGAYFKQLADKDELLHAGSAYKLSSKIRDTLDAAYGQSPVTIQVKTLLTDLADKLPDMAERDYYKEALLCYKSGSRRAAVVMTWNIAYAHLCDHIIAQRLVDFNARWVQSMPGMHKNKTKAIAVLDDFNDQLKESEVLSICRDGSIITKNIYNILHAALGKRNAAAHPNPIVIDQLQTDAYIVDLITNVVLQIV
jgi:hypothetical protein